MNQFIRNCTNSKAMIEKTYRPTNGTKFIIRERGKEEILQPI